MNLPASLLYAPAPTPLRGEGLDVLPRMKLVLFRAGFAGSLSCVPEEIRREADLAYETGKRLSDPRAFALCDDPARLPGGSAPPEFYAASRACAFVSSLGPAIDEEIDALFARGSSLKGALLDAWASESVEAFNETIHEALAREADSAGLAPVKMNGVERFSPGYGEVSVLANAAWMALFPPGLALASGKTGILTPRKSTVCLLAWKG
jgi:hypothetical protein